MGRDNFIFYRSFKEAISLLPAKAQLKTLWDIIDYALDGKEPSFDNGPERAIFVLARPQIDANNKRYLNGCKGAEYGKMGGAPKGNQNARKTTPKQPQNNGNTTPNENDNENANGNEECCSNTPTTKRANKAFVRPTFAEVQAYCKERGNSVDAQRFIDYYTSNGWKVGRNAMKDWRAAVRTWESQPLSGNAGNRESKQTVGSGYTVV